MLIFARRSNDIRLPRPRLWIALVLMMPLLTAFSSLVGILGGAVVGLAMLDVTLQQYVEQRDMTGSIRSGMREEKVMEMLRKKVKIEGQD